MSEPAQLRDPSDGRRHVLDATSTIIGRDDISAVCIDVPAISRQHAEIERTPHGYVITDLGSRNGTFVNSERIGRTPHPLRDDDEIVLGGATSFRFVDPMATPLAPAIGRLTGVWIDPDTRAVWVDAQLIEPPLSDRQQALLELLDSRPDAVVSRDEIIACVWADVAADGVSAEAVDALVKRLRARLRPLQVAGDYLDVRRGRGIRLRR